MPYTSRVASFLLSTAVGLATLPLNAPAASFTRSTPMPGIMTGADGTWYSVPAPATINYLARRSHTVVFDPIRQRYLSFGGRSLDDTVWTRGMGNGAAPWVPLAVTGAAPSPRSGHCAVYDPTGDRMLLFGGDDGTLRNDLWELTLSGTPHWNPLATQSTPPAPRRFASAIFDAGRNRMVVFAGFAGGAYENATWTLDFNTSPPTWSLLAPSGTPPQGRGQAAVAYDPTRDRMVVFGGQGALDALPDLWTLTFGASPGWTQQSASALPGKRFGMGAAYDASHDRMLLTCGGVGTLSFNDLWSMNLGTFAFNVLNLSVKPSSRQSPGFAYDGISQSGVLDGGAASNVPPTSISTWGLRFDPIGVWTQLFPDPTPLALRYAAPAFYDRTRDRFLMTAGYYASNGDHYLGDLCELQIGRDSSWVQVTTGPAGYARYGHAAAYDPVRDRILVLGGMSDGSTLLNDLWQIRLSPTVSIEPLTTSGTPPEGRWFASATYDPIRDRLIVYGGTPQQADVDLWQITNLSGTPTWSPIPLASGSPVPPLRSMHGAVYDPYGDRLLVFGGFPEFGSTALGDLWALSLGSPAQWTAIASPGPPSPRASAMLQLDPNRQRVLLYGGHGGQSQTNVLGDVWELSLPALTWHSLAPAGTIPPSRWWDLAAFDDVHDRLLISGGSDGIRARSDVWRLQFSGGLPTATEIALLSSDARADGVTLRWALSGDASTYARLERRDATSDWRTIEAGPVSGSFVTFNDRDVVAGARYAYRLTALAGTSMSTSSEVWIDVPAGPSFSLAGFSPNPATRDARVAFSLGSRALVTLEVVDVGGRRVASRRIEAPIPGAQSIAIAPAGGLSPGLYFVKLTQGGRTLMARGTVMR